MKDYNEIANSVFQRREEYLKEKKRKKALILRNATVALSCCIMIAVGIGIWNIGLLKDIKPSPHKEDYTLPSPIVTTAVTTSDEDITTENTVATATNDILDTTAIVSDNSAQSGANGTKTTSANGHSGSGNVTTSRSDSKTSESNVRTTASSIEITSSNNSSHQNLTTSHHQSPVLTTQRSDVRTTTTTPRISTRTTTRRTSTTTRRTSTTTRRTSTTTRRTSTTTRRTSATTRIPVATTTTRAQTKPVTSTTRVYTTIVYTYSPVATSTTALYTQPAYTTTWATSISPQPAYTTTAAMSTIVYTSTTRFEPVATTVYPAVSSTYSPVLSTTTTKPPHSEFYYNGTTYTVAGCENFDTSFTGDLLHKSGIYDVALGRLTLYTVYAYKDFSPDFLCMVEFDDGETFLGINWDYVPDNLGEFLDAIDFPDSFNLYSLYDSVNSKYINSPDCTPLTEFLKSNKNAGIIQIIDDFYPKTKVEFDYDMLSTGDYYTCIFGHISISADQTLVIFMADDYGHRTYEFNVDSTTLDKLYASLQKNV